MSLEITNDLGKLAISDKIVVSIIVDALGKPELDGKIWLANKRGKYITAITKLVGTEAFDVETKSTSSGAELEFSVIVLFGASIKTLTRVLSDQVRDTMEERTGIRFSRITVNIAGVKSKQIAKRSTKVVYKYEA